MNKIQIEYSTNFAREFKKLSQNKQKEALKAEKIFKADQFAVKLKTHKLTGKLKGLWAFSINYQDRIIFEFAGEGKVIFYRIGSHDIYK